MLDLTKVRIKVPPDATSALIELRMMLAHFSRSHPVALRRLIESGPDTRERAADDVDVSFEAQLHLAAVEVFLLNLIAEKTGPATTVVKRDDLFSLVERLVEKKEILVAAKSNERDRDRLYFIESSGRRVYAATLRDAIRKLAAEVL